MATTSRNFKLDTEWCVVHIPDRPNGFGVLIVGDQNHFVDEKTSFWIQNNGRYQIMNFLLSKGYTVFYSNLYGRNWGCQDAVSLALRLYHIIMSRETLNKRIHILAEGMGVLVALQVMKELREQIRSVAMINPCIDLKAHIKKEKEHKFFYKRIMRELTSAYGIDEKYKGSITDYLPDVDYLTSVPVKIWQTTTGINYDAKLHSKPFEENRKKHYQPTWLTYHLSEKRFGISDSITRFYKGFEKEL